MSAFTLADIPFSVGQRNCPGKQLGLNETRVALARFVHKFDAEWGVSFDEATFLSQYRDLFSARTGALYLRLRPRNHRPQELSEEF